MDNRQKLVRLNDIINQIIKDGYMTFYKHEEGNLYTPINISGHILDDLLDVFRKYRNKIEEKIL